MNALYAATLSGYAELHTLSNFSFQRGASQPEELVARAHALGYAALALTDECSVAGMVRAHVEAKKLGLKLLCGSEFAFEPSAAQPGAMRLVVLARHLEGWGHLCEFITAARRAAAKGSYRLDWQHPGLAQLQDCELLLVPDRAARRSLNFESLCARLWQLRALFGTHLWLAAELLLGADDELWLHKLQEASRLTGVPLVAAGDALMHVRSRKPLHDVISAVRLGRAVADCGLELQANAEAHLRPRLRLASIYPEELLAHTLVVAARCEFSLDELRYQYPLETVLPGMDAAQTLRHHTEQGATVRYPEGLPESVRKQVEHELALISELRYEMYFLTVHDIVNFARSQGILCQGRGSAANSAVCYCLGVTEVDPARMSMLFERFISRERNEPPDIDVDFEHQRREEVIQYIYQRYGRERAAIAATVVSYRPRSALRDSGKALGFAPEQVDALAKQHFWFDGRSLDDEAAQQRLREAGLDPADARVRQWLGMAAQLLGFPRHLSQHVGGFVLTQGKLTRLVPVENAAMPDRSIIQWDKDDLDAMGLLKVDVLALGMLSALQRCLQMVGQWRGRPLRLQDIPAEDPATYDMICAADTVGVFQIESRAQMSMLPRLQPRVFYDLVIEVAIVRPGPIQGGMVHPYLNQRKRLRQGLPPEPSPGPALTVALQRTLGVPIFQEQVMQIAMLAAGFSADEADSLRRSMAAWKRKGGVNRFHMRIVEGMKANGYSAEFAEQIFSQIEGFGEYGFPESHAASFALLAYASSWLKRHEPACFLASLLNSQPMGFYSPSQLVQDARRHEVQVRAIDVTCSDWDCSLESADDSAPGQAFASLARASSAPEAHAPPFGLSLSKPFDQAQDRPFDTAQDRPFDKLRANGLWETNGRLNANGRWGAPPQPTVRLGLRLVHGLGEAVAQRIVQARQAAPFSSVADLARRAALDAGDLKALAAADALLALAGHRRQQVWDAAALHAAPELLQDAPTHEAAHHLPSASEGEAVVHDYAATGLTLRSHPLALLRSRLKKLRLQTAAELRDLPNGRLVRGCGIVTVRQQPSTAKGVVFITLEDETGSVNVIVWKALREQQRSVVLHARLLAVHGVWQRDEDSGGEVRHLVAQHLRDLTPMLGALADAGLSSRDFH